MEGLSRGLLTLWPALSTFVTTPGVQPTNSAAERALRPAVLWRQGGFGSQRAEDAELVARLLTVAAPCQQHDRSLLPSLTPACLPAPRTLPSPSVLPAHAPADEA